jgi:hypothetical protein
VHGARWANSQGLAVEDNLVAALVREDNPEESVGRGTVTHGVTALLEFESKT